MQDAGSIDDSDVLHVEQEAVMEAQERRQPLMDLVGSDQAEQSLAGQQAAKQETLGQQDLHHLLDAVLPPAQNASDL